LGGHSLLDGVSAVVRESGRVPGGAYGFEVRAGTGDGVGFIPSRLFGHHEPNSYFTRPSEAFIGLLKELGRGLVGHHYLLALAVPIFVLLTKGKLVLKFLIFLITQRGTKSGLLDLLLGLTLRQRLSPLFLKLPFFSDKLRNISALATA
jgi:hypothetical protein